MDWLRGQMREHIANLESTEHVAENIFKLRRTAPVAETRDSLADREDSPAALQLVYQLADVIRSKEEHAAEIEGRAQALAKRALDELKLAETRLRSAEIARNAAEARVDEANTRMEEFERAFEHTEARIAAAETQLSAAFLRAKTAETRAAEAEKALRRLEEAIRTQLLKARGQASSHSAAAA
jgi:chromosome segregation ATPase